MRPYESNNANDNQLTYHDRNRRDSTEEGRAGFGYLAPHYTTDGEWVGRVW